MISLFEMATLSLPLPVKVGKERAGSVRSEADHGIATKGEHAVVTTAVENVGIVE